MDLFNFKKKGKIIDLSKKFNEENKAAENKVDFGESAKTKEETIDVEEVGKKRKRFAKRFTDLVEKMDSLSAKIYHFEQRLEVLEKKLRVNNFEGE